jgi:hypothetical protein
MSLISYGEDMFISIYDDSSINAGSVSTGKNVGFDFGKNRSNIKKFFRQLDLELGIVKKEPATSRKKPMRRLKDIVLGKKTGEPEDGELIER